MDFLNERASPPLIIRPEPPSRSGGYWTNTYVDPTDQCRFNPAKLTSLERGHVYLYVYASNGWVHVHMPLRYMDTYSGLKLDKVPSFEVMSPAHVRSLGPRTRKRASLVKQRFRISSNHMDQLQTICRNNGWLLEYGGINLQDFMREMHSISDTAKSLLNDFSDLRAALSSSDIPNPTEWLSSSTVNREILIQSCKEVCKDWGNLLFQKELLGAEEGRVADSTTADVAWRSCAPNIDALRTLDWGRLTRETNHRFRVLTGDTEDLPKPVGSLGVELRALAVHYPALHYLVGQDDGTVLLDVPGGLQIHVTPGGLQATGEMSVLEDLPAPSSEDDRFSGL